MFPAATETMPHDMTTVLPASDLEGAQRSRGTVGAFAPGHQIGSYRILAELGRGGQGIVYLADDLRLPRLVALKVLSQTGPRSREAVRRFRREAEVASKLTHPGICTVYEAQLADDVPFIAMQYVPGRDLLSLIRAERSDSPTRPDADRQDDAPATTIDHDAVFAHVAHIENAARALHVAHEAGVVHRDIKPGNIMITDDGQPVVLDFGLARLSQDEDTRLTRSGSVFGTPAYMSPEQLVMNERERPLDRRTDVWSFGVTLYEAVTGRRPFAAPTIEGLGRAIESQDPIDPRRLNSAVTRDLKVVIDTALAKDPRKRYQTAADLAEDLKRVRTRQPILARPPGPAERLGAWVRRNPALAASVVAAFLFLTSGLIIAIHLLGEALDQKARADANAQDLGTALREFERLADFRRLDDLVRAANTSLWPPLPEREEALRRWLDDARELSDRVATHGRALQAWRLSDDASVEDRWRHGKLSELVEAGAGLRDADRFGPTIASVEWRLEMATSVVHDSIEAHDGLWTRTIREIADESANPKYGGLILKPQLGLVPLGRDPASRLYEFAHILSGKPPARDDTGKLRIDADSAIVLVLIPGGRATMGAQRRHPDQPHHDPLASEDESPVHDVELAPYFLSKYELMQGQWRRLAGGNPSFYHRDYEFADLTMDDRHPVEQVTWLDATETLRRWGLLLPTEAQWEHGCRGGTSTPWHCGKEPSSLQGYANIADEKSVRRYFGSNAFEPGFVDGHAIHAPVGLFKPNGFGLHDVHGNIWEWCRDLYGPYTLPVRPGDCLRLVKEAPTRVSRGGGYERTAHLSRCSWRWGYKEDGRYNTVGVRPSRALDL